MYEKIKKQLRYKKQKLTWMIDKPEQCGCCVIPIWWMVITETPRESRPDVRMCVFASSYIMPKCVKSD